MALVVIIGGARSGKSDVAEALARQRQQLGEPVCYAVFENSAGTPPLSGRRDAQRPEGFTPLAATEREDWVAGASEDGLLLLDSLGAAVALVMGSRMDAERTELHQATGRLVERILSREGDTIVVAEQMEAGYAREPVDEQVYRDLLGGATRLLVSASDASYLCVAGRLLELDRLSGELSWPED